MTKYALLIGNDTYQDASFDNLLVPGKDIEAFQQILVDQSLCGFSTDNTLVLLNQPLQDVRRAVGEFFKNKRKDDLLLFYFSGHGELDEDGDLYLAFNNTQKTNLMGTALEASMVESGIRKTNSTRQIIILDCCYSGAMAVGGKSSGEAMELERWKGHGREFLMSSSAAQRSWEAHSIDVKSENSLFTHYLVEGIKSGKASRGEMITVEQLFNYASMCVSRQTSRMTPERRVENQRQEIVISRNPKPPLKLPKSLVEGLKSDSYLARERAVQLLHEKYIKPNDLSVAPKVRMLLQRRLSGDDMESDFRVRKAIEVAIENKFGKPVDEKTQATSPKSVTSSATLDTHVDQPSEILKSTVPRYTEQPRVVETSNSAAWAFTPFLFLLPFSIDFDSFGIYLSLLIWPVAAWMGFRFRRTGVIVVATSLFLSMFYQGWVGPWAYRYSSGEYLVALMICWSCAHSESWWSWLESFKPSGMVLFALLVVSDVRLQLRGDFGSLGWTSFGAPFVLIAFFLAMAGRRTGEILAVAVCAAVIGLILLETSRGAVDLGNGMSVVASYGFNSMRDVFRVAIVLVIGSFVGRALHSREVPQWLTSWRGYYAFTLLWIVSIHYTTLRLPGNYFAISGSDLALWALCFASGIFWKRKAIAPLSIAISLSIIESVLLNFTRLELGFIQVGVNSPGRAVGVFLAAALFCVFGAKVAAARLPVKNSN